MAGRLPLEALDDADDNMFDQENNGEYVYHSTMRDQVIHHHSSSIQLNVSDSIVNEGHDVRDKHIQTQVQAQLSRISRLIKIVENSVNNASNVLNVNDLNENQRLAATGTELHGQLKLLRTAMKDLKSIPNADGFIEIPNFLLDLELDIVDWEAWESKLTAKVKEINNVHRSNPRVIKFNNSDFPSFDGTTNFKDWWSKWEQLARLSGYNEESLGVKLKESLKGDVLDQMGSTLMVTGNQVQIIDRLKQIYEKPMTIMLNTAQEFFAVKPCGGTVIEARKFITASNDNIQRCLQNGLTLESVCLNFTLMNLPTEIKSKMIIELNNKCPSFKLTTEHFNKAFELVAGMVEENTNPRIVSCYKSQASSIHLNEEDLDKKEVDMFDKMTPTLIVPLVNNVGSYRVRTLLDSGSSANWITRDILKDINFTKKGEVKMKVHHHGGSKEQKVEVVQVYINIDQGDVELPGLQSHGGKPSPYRPPIPINCFVTELFGFHKMVPGLQKFLKNNTQLTPRVINRVSDPSSKDIDHSVLSLGSGLVLSKADRIKILQKRCKHKVLKDLDLLLEDTIFGFAISGRIPIVLQSDTVEVCVGNVTPVVMYETIGSSIE